MIPKKDLINAEYLVHYRDGELSVTYAGGRTTADLVKFMKK